MSTLKAYEDRVQYLEERYLDVVASMGRHPSAQQQAREASAWAALEDARVRLAIARMSGGSNDAQH